MPQYALLIYNDEAEGMELFQRMSEEEQQANMGRWWGYTQALQDAGVHVAGEALHPTSTARTVTLQGGERLVTDGPFAETKEQLGGFYIVDVPSQEEALEWAAKVPSADRGKVEVREIMAFEE